jgi:hypothetical protein
MDARVTSLVQSIVLPGRPGVTSAQLGWREAARERCLAVEVVANKSSLARLVSREIAKRSSGDSPPEDGEARLSESGQGCPDSRHSSIVLPAGMLGLASLVCSVELA